jgi:hypothetical protein
MFPDIGTALSDAPGSPALATTNVVVAVCVVPAASWALATTVWGPGSSGAVGEYTQLPFASAVTVTVVPVSEWITIVTVAPGVALPLMRGWDVVTSAFSSGERICNTIADEVACALPDAGSVGVNVGVSVAVIVAVGIFVGVSVRIRLAVGVAVGVRLPDLKPALGVLAPVIVICAGVVPTSTFAVESLSPPTNVLDAN